MTWTNSTASSFNASDMLAKMKELSAKMQSVPNRFITTTATLASIKTFSDQGSNYGDRWLAANLPSIFSGIPIEDYPTVRECLDRMMNPKEGERLKLVLREKIMADYADHPFVQKLAAEMADQYRINYGPQ